MRPKTRLALVLLALIALPLTAIAGGIAIVQAPEQSSGICAGANAAEAFACARKQCVEGGAQAEDCQEMTYCDASWTVDIFMQSKEGNHWHEYRCGWRNRAEAEAAGKLVCNAERMKGLMECTTVQIYDPEAKPQMKLTED